MKLTDVLSIEIYEHIRSGSEVDDGESLCMNHDYFLVTN